MILSDQTLKQWIKEKKIVIDPIGEEQIQAASVDLRLGDHFLILEDNQMDILTLNSDIKYREVNAKEITLPPHTFLLATTKEFVKVPKNVVGFVEGRSSIGRMGLFIQNAGWIDPGFHGKITLELYNANSLPIKLTSGRRICQMIFSFLDKESLNPYKGKYLGQEKTVGSRIFLDKEVKV